MCQHWCSYWLGTIISELNDDLVYWRKYASFSLNELTAHVNVLAFFYSFKANYTCIFSDYIHVSNHYVYRFKLNCTQVIIALHKSYTMQWINSKLIWASRRRSSKPFTDLNKLEIYGGIHIYTFSMFHAQTQFENGPLQFAYLFMLRHCLQNSNAFINGRLWLFIIIGKFVRDINSVSCSSIGNAQCLIMTSLFVWSVLSQILRAVSRAPVRSACD